MTKTLIALALAGVLIGCSSGGDDNDDSAATGGTSSNGTSDTGSASGAGSQTGDSGSSTDGTGSVTAPAAQGGTPTADSKAGVWLGDFGTGAPGVYVIDNDNVITGLAVAADGSAESVFGSLGDGSSFTGQLDNHFHPASNPAVPGIFAPRGEATDADSYSLNIVNGQTIEGTGGDGVALVYAGPGALTPATIESVAGSWSGAHSFCGLEGNCSVVSVNVTFSGSDLSGNTQIVNVDTQEVSDFSPAITGSIAPFGDVLTTSFTWNELTFAGVVYFDTNGNLILNADDTSGETDHQTLTSLLTRQ